MDSKGYAEKLFEFLGAEVAVAIDNSNYEGAAIITDLNSPMAGTLKNQFTAVFDGGCLEHIFNFPQAIKNCMGMLRVGGHFLSVTPANNFCGHGFYQFSPELYFRVFSEANGFALRTILTKESNIWFVVNDPDQFGGRVELQNNRPTYLFVLAKKIADREVFLQPPQQSDYARKWKADSTKTGAAPHVAPSFAIRLRAVVPPSLKEALRPFAANISIRYRYPCYQRVDEAALLGGDF